jgi:hypothetical protein
MPHYLLDLMQLFLIHNALALHFCLCLYGTKQSQFQETCEQITNTVITLAIFVTGSTTKQHDTQISPFCQVLIGKLQPCQRDSLVIDKLENAVNSRHGKDALGRRCHIAEDKTMLAINQKFTQFQ